MTQSPITIEVTVRAPIEKVWEYWNEPEHIMNWDFASDDWEAPAAANDLAVGGTFVVTMAAKDGSSSFELEGEYTKVIEHKEIDYTMDDGRKVSIMFSQAGDSVKITQTFDPETINPRQMQQEGWQAILNNFKKYTESQN